MTAPESQPTIVCLVPDAWDSLLRGQQQIFGRLSDRYRVIAVEPGRELGGRQLFSAIASLPNVWRNPQLRVFDGIEVATGPPLLPALRTLFSTAVLRRSFPLTQAINLRIGRRHLRRLYQSADIVDPILVSWGFGHIGSDAHRLFDEPDHLLSCYVVYDESAEFLHNQRVSAIVSAADRAATTKADLVLTTSLTQFERRRDLNENVHFMPNGVDFDLFSALVGTTTEPPAELADLPKPIVGYAGWMGYQLDVELLCQVSEAYEHGSVVLVGPDHLPESAETQRLKSRPNVHLLGRREPHELPTFLHHFDVAMLPYRLKGHTKSIYPLKLHEYLAAGCSIVSTNLPNLAQHDDVIRICRSSAEFVEQVEAAADEQRDDAIGRRVETARAYSWDARADQVHELLTQARQDIIDS